MTTTQLLPFLAVVAMITVTPGPDSALVLRNTIASGSRHGVLTALGCSSGLFVWGIVSALGLATVVSASSSLFAAIRVIGGIYLTWLGVRMIWSKRKSAERVATAGSAIRLDANARRPFVEGLLSNLLNPKAAAFFTAVLPQFITPEDAVLWATLLLAGITSAAALAGLLIYITLAARARVALGHPSMRQWLDRITGAVLVSLGVRMLAREVRA
jgi:RhtB (resistance to homoserine/threonine) family protein